MKTSRPVDSQNASSTARKLASPIEKAGNTMWNDIVKANCARASTTASQPSNIGTTHYRPQRGAYHAGFDDSTAQLAEPTSQAGAQSSRRQEGETIFGRGLRKLLSLPQMQSDPAGGHPGRVVGGYLGVRGRRSGRLETCSASSVRDHTNLCGALGTAIDHL